MHLGTEAQRVNQWASQSQAVVGRGELEPGKNWFTPELMPELCTSEFSFHLVNLVWVLACDLQLFIGINFLCVIIYLCAGVCTTAVTCRSQNRVSGPMELQAAVRH